MTKRLSNHGFDLRTCDDRWYDKFVPVAGRLYQQHLDELHKEGKL